MDEQGGAPMPDLSNMLSQIMANPRALSMLSSLLGASAPPAEAVSAAPATVETAAEKLPQPIPPAGARADEDRRRLLLALKPFVNPERRRAIDKILMITEALALLQKKGGR